MGWVGQVEVGGAIGGGVGGAGRGGWRKWVGQVEVRGCYCLELV